MKLLYTANARIPSEKAHPYQIVQMCEAFADAGAEVTLLYAGRRNPPHLATGDIWGHYAVKRSFSAARVTVLDVYALAERLPRPLARLWTALAALLVQITYHLALLPRLSTAPDAVIYSRDAVTLAVIAALLPRRARCAFYEAHTFPATGFGLRLRRWMARRVGGVVAITGHLAERYRALGIPAEHVLAAHDGFRAARFALEGDRAYWRRHYGWPQDAFIVGYAGRFLGGQTGIEKGLGTLVEAFELLCADESARSAYLALVGGPESYLDPLRARLGERLLAPGMVPPDAVPGYLRAFDVCAMTPPWNDFFAYYTSPLKLFEYMASGTPLVASDLPSTAEVICDGVNGLLVSPSDAAALADALRRLRDDSALGQRLAMQAAQDVRDYTWDARARRVLDFIAGRMASSE